MPPGLCNLIEQGAQARPAGRVDLLHVGDAAVEMFPEMRVLLPVLRIQTMPQAVGQDRLETVDFRSYRIYSSVTRFTCSGLGAAFKQVG